MQLGSLFIGDCIQQQNSFPEEDKKGKGKQQKNLPQQVASRQKWIYLRSAGNPRWFGLGRDRND